ISVVIPTLNEEKCIEECLLSLRAQRYDERYEIILVDGQSGDRTQAIAKKYVDKVLVKPPKGPATARNIGAREAKYPIVAFIDADCIAAPNWLEEIEKSFRENIVGLGGVVRPSSGTWFDKLMFKINSDWWVRVSARFGVYQLYGNNCAYRRANFLKIGGFNENVSFFEDTELSMRMKKVGRVKVNKNMAVATSIRRFRQMGYIRLGMINVQAFLNFLLGRPIKTKYFQEIKH
ncbi:MAG: glycosyltransferase, partial [Candidatus Micrarchaeota archaeon]